jgi:hypothetical protein
VIGSGAHLTDLVSGLQSSLGLPVATNFDPDETLVKGGDYYAQFYHSVSRFPEVKISEPNSLVTTSLMTLKGEEKICEKGKPCNTTYDFDRDGQILALTLDSADARPGLRSLAQGYFVQKVPERVRLFRRQRPFDIADTEHCNASGCHWMPLQPSFNSETPS